MVKKPKYVLKDSDKKLILKGISRTPCLECKLKKNGCSGCEQKNIYDKKVKDLQEKNIFEFTILTENYKENYIAKREILREIKNDLKQLKTNFNLDNEYQKIEEEMLFEYVEQVNSCANKFKELKKLLEEGNKILKIFKENLGIDLKEELSNKEKEGNNMHKRYKVFFKNHKGKEIFVGEVEENTANEKHHLANCLTLIRNYIKENFPDFKIYYIRINGTTKDGMYIIDYGSHSEFFYCYEIKE